MKVGINLLLWTDDPCDPGWLPLYERLKRMGFDGIELPIFDGDPDRFADLGRRLDDIGLERTATTALQPEVDPISPDGAIRTAAASHLRKIVDCTQAAGATMLGGPLYAAIGRFSGTGPTPAEWERSVEVVRAVADHAADAGIGLTFEFLNRFEIYLLNCADDTARYVRDLDRPNVGVHYDSFHAHIEEKDAGAAIRRNAGTITHVHLSENDRSTPGAGQVDWDTTFDTLAAIGYDDWLTIEAFGGTIASLAAATKIWRPLFADEETLARDGHDFIRREWAKRKAS